MSPSEGMEVVPFEEVSLTIDVIKKLDDYELVDRLRRVTEATIAVSRLSAALKYVLGLILLEIKQRPHIYYATYGSFSNFVEHWVCNRIGVSRAFVYEGLRLANRLPDLSSDLVESIGSSKLDLLARVLMPGSADKEKLIEEAKKRSLEDFRKYLEEKGYISKDEHRIRYIAVSQRVYEMFQDLRKNPDVVAAAGGSDASSILEMLIGEFWSGFMPHHESQPATGEASDGGKEDEEEVWP